jgi:hypothetical protein
MSNEEFEKSLAELEEMIGWLRQHHSELLTPLLLIPDLKQASDKWHNRVLPGLYSMSLDKFIDRFNNFLNVGRSDYQVVLQLKAAELLAMLHVVKGGTEKIETL